MIKELTKTTRGDIGIIEVILFTCIIVFIVFPVFSIVFEKVALDMKADEIKDIIKDATESTFVALNIDSTSVENIDVDIERFKEIFEEYLIINFNLNEDFSPKENSMVDAPVTINKILFYGSEDIPITHPTKEITYNRPFIEIEVLFPIKPHLYRKAILNALGREYLEVNINYYYTLPINN
ncbi:hypothetical protein EDC18_101329 [Natranaerovirga pectinivora]|uniref:TadE-like protein n=1 Tax=Natranaerovirga pectinivora TaxID=682400 RepID=A0A4R3MR92_9FIRM|nr:hypothetical protein [Natranaerovirga pectinivora]TCT17033.1 hypothetical protein EDC18_101329 [Natranaerovirga pectinivora]